MSQALCTACQISSSGLEEKYEKYQKTGVNPMLQEVKQRPYIDDFLKFVSSFALTEQVSVSEMELVEGNLKILLERIQHLKESTTIPPLLGGTNRK